MRETSHDENVVEERIRDWMPLLFLIDVGLLFAGIFVDNVAAWWIWIPFHFAACVYTVFVLWMARSASRFVQPSIPFQFQVGTLLYLSCHAIKLFGPAQIPIAMIGYLLFAGPISLLFLFDHLND